MPDYKKMYLKMVRASEQTIRILVEAQQECEELYISAPKQKMKVLDVSESSESE